MFKSILSQNLRREQSSVYSHIFLEVREFAIILVELFLFFILPVKVIDGLIIKRKKKQIVVGTNYSVFCVPYILKLLFMDYMRMICFIHEDSIVNSF